ncbi:DNA primase [Bythopirellula goksoeyrii]|uniref:DNA primase n=2 Tax=Bythopirellula goksoeyrii TaxID=1400387 RepID=A0A5B9QBB0_9BACT|nr:DNA primase [Bythopirellula goksoeyrii]
MRRILELMDWQEVTCHGDQLRGPCPIHKSSSERSRSFSVNLNKNAYHCFGCGSKGNQLDLASEYFGLSLYQAAREVCQRTGIEVPIRGAFRR